ncbi:MAG: Eco29kI family restriction endonuclease [Verrucomicrobiaceae bacterium]|nr:MAG: Eco29kI family restriction endonuclease [Verrucomicrobiaceae bacterium]
MIQREALRLGSITRFSGAGIYVLYYTGSFEAYAPVRKWNPGGEQLKLPIYVGKAIPAGGRKGDIDPEVSAKGTPLLNRLEDHRKSIQQAQNLSLNDFWCRFPVVDDIGIPLA